MKRYIHVRDDETKHNLAASSPVVGVVPGLVSIVIPVFNSETHLISCIESAIGQSYPLLLGQICYFMSNCSNCSSIAREGPSSSLNTAARTLACDAEKRKAMAEKYWYHSRFL